jgi:adenylyltransferase/sulfurtransferase
MTSHLTRNRWWRTGEVKSYRSCDWCWWFRLSRFTIAPLGIALEYWFWPIEIHNLHRQILYTEDQVGLPKATTAKALVEKLNPLIKVHFWRKASIENASRIISDFDIVVDGSDNFTTRYLVNDTCVALGKTVVYGSILVLKDSLLFLITKEAKLRDLFPEPPSSKDVPNCSFNGC